MVKITKQVDLKGYEQFRITLPAEIVRALDWVAGDELKPSIQKGGILFTKAK